MWLESRIRSPQPGFLARTGGCLPTKWRRVTVRRRRAGRKPRRHTSLDRRTGMRMARSSVVFAFLAVIGPIAPAQAQAPAGDITRPITLVVPIAAGGGMDTIGRAIAEKLQE